MIRINKNRSDETGRKISPGREWFNRSRAAQVEAIDRAGATGYQFRADVYGADSVRASLSELFFHKCGYCEYPLARTDPNVEHYRPKSRVSEVPKHPGYYWLAYDWSNLLLACEFCNQLRREPPTRAITARTRAAGKADKFPLLDEARRAYSPDGEISLEEPLLVNPTVEEPSEHLTFDPSGRPIYKSKKGKVSIEVYNLDSRQLNKQRRHVIARMTRLLKLKNMAEMIPDQLARWQMLTEIKAEIRERTDNPAPYAAAARAVAKNPNAFGL